MSIKDQLVSQILSQICIIRYLFATVKNPPSAALRAFDSLYESRIIVMGRDCPMKLIPANDVILELEKTAAGCEAAAKEAPEPEAGKLRKFAQLCRGWMMSLKFGSWTS
jgi:hypothetical protein